MAAKELLFDVDARAKLKKGVDALSEIGRASCRERVYVLV